MHQKKKWYRGNNKPHITKPLRQAIMKRSKLKNKANKTKLLIDIRNYKKPRNYVVNLNKNAKFGYFCRYNCKDGKPFWVNFKPYFSNKHSKADNNIVLNEDGELILKNKEIANTFNDYFGSVVENLNLEHWDEDSNSNSVINHKRPLLFNIFINDLILNVIKSEVCNFADGNTLYSFDKKLGTIFSNLKYDLENVLSWFQANSLKANPSKFHFMILGDKQNTSFVFNINGKKINSREIELLGIVIDNQLKFKKHIENLCRKASFKLHALRRIRKFLTVEKARILANAFINSQFDYAPLIWMFASKTAINKILKIHYRTLQVVYREYHKSYEELLQINKDISIHQEHLRILALEVYKSITHFNPEFMWHCFNTNPIPYNLRK